LFEGGFEILRFGNLSFISQFSNKVISADLNSLQQKAVEVLSY
jgi:hypothetical protein